MVDSSVKSASHSDGHAAQVNRTSATAIKSNFAWLAADRFLALVHSLLIGGVVARYLGPASLGVLAFAATIATIAKPFVNLGADAVLTREFIQHNDRSRLFWTAFFARTIGGVCVILSVAAVLISGVTGLSTLERWIICVATLPIAFSGFTIATLLLRAESRNKIAVVALNVVMLITSSIRLFFVFNESDLIWFASLAAIQAIVGGLAIHVLSAKFGLLPRICRPSFEILRELFAECWPLILSSLSVVLYMNIDFVMLRIIKGTHDAGIYSVAVRLSAVWYFVPTILATSFFPLLTEKFPNPDNYTRALKRFFEINVLLSYASVAVGLLIFPVMISILFGPNYAESISVFRLHVFGVIFVFMGVARSQHLNLNKLHTFSMLSTAIGMLVNVSLNLFLIPLFAAYGAAVATVISFAVAGVATTFFHSKLIEIGKLQVKSLLMAPMNIPSIFRSVRTR